MVCSAKVSVGFRIDPARTYCIILLSSMSIPVLDISGRFLFSVIGELSCIHFFSPVNLHLCSFFSCYDLFRSTQEAFAIIVGGVMD